MTIMTRTRPTVKPTRRSPRIDRPFGEGLEERGLCCPIDQRPLPKINGQGLTSEEFDRVNRAKNRAWHAYAVDCPEASLPECDVVARKAATDELRRLLMERPSAPALATAVEVEPEVAVEASPVVSPPHSSIPAPKFARRRIHDRGDELWWSQVRDAEGRGLGDEGDDDELESAYHAWLFSAAPLVISDLSDDRNGAFHVGELLD
ncbi:hypothetical protein [Singulisphaera sp. PoT]|uniref:hypothetical protein n=1 Tax=Singulisphaera sp. PoT TaxID=3411797 RepID=UPI003BF58A61